MKPPDRVRLQHIVDAANEAISFTENKTRESLTTNRMLVLSLVRCIEIIGEAASRISNDFQEAHPSLPWAEMIGMRNRLIHAYFDVDLDRVWDTVNDELPSLRDEIEHLLLQEK